MSQATKRNEAGRCSPRSPRRRRSRPRSRSARPTARRRTSCSTPRPTTPTSTPGRRRERRDAITIASNWIPGQVPANGPNFFRFDDRARYYNNIDNNGDGVADIKYRFTFDTEIRNPNSFLYAGPGTQDFNDPGLNVIQTLRPGSRGVRQQGRARPTREGRQQRPGRAAQHRAEDVPELRQLRRRGDEDARRRHEAVRRHPRRSVLRRPRGRRSTRSTSAWAPATRAQGRDDLSGYWTSSTVMQIPEEQVTRNGKPVASADATNAVVGVWSTTERRKLEVTNANYGGRLAREGQQESQQVGPGLAARQPADQRGRDPARDEGQVQPHDSRSRRRAVRQVRRPSRSWRRC